MVPEIWSATDIIFCYFGPFFFLFYSTKNPQKIKIFKNRRRYNHFTKSVPKIMIICCAVLEIWHMTHFFHFGLFIDLSPPDRPKKWKFKKNENNTRRYHHFTHVYQKLWSDDVQFLRYGVRQMDGRTDRWMDGKSDI